MSTDSDVSPLERRALDAWRALRAEQELALAALEESYRQRRQERAIERVREVTGAAAGMIGEEEPDTWNTPGGIVVPVAVEGLVLRVVFPAHGLERVELEHYCEACHAEDHRGRDLRSLADLGQELEQLDPLCMECRNAPAGRYCTVHSVRHSPGDLVEFDPRHPAAGCIFWDEREDGPAPDQPSSMGGLDDPFPPTLTGSAWEHVNLDEGGVGVIVPQPLAEVARGLYAWRG